jgi:hypothetical protein
MVPVFAPFSVRQHPPGVDGFSMGLLSFDGFSAASIPDQHGQPTYSRRFSSRHFIQRLDGLSQVNRCDTHSKYVHPRGRTLDFHDTCPFPNKRVQFRRGLYLIDFENVIITNVSDADTDPRPSAAWSARRLHAACRRKVHGSNMLRGAKFDCKICAFKPLEFRY